MIEHTVIQGESLLSIAHQYGFFWETVWEHPRNAALKQQRKDPNILFPGDVVVIPELRAKTISVATGSPHRFRVKRRVAVFRVKVEDASGKPCPNHKYQLTIGEIQVEGKTNDRAIIEMDIPITAQNGKLLVWLEDERKTILSWDLNLGYLDPIDTLSGVQARLSNLGFPISAIEGEMGAETQSALLAFQITHGLSATGELDDTTRQRLEQLHDRK